MVKRSVVLSRDVCLVLFLVINGAISEGNVAGFKQAAQSSNFFPDKWLANAAVDGCVDRIIQSGCCTHTQGGNNGVGPKTVWWKVDLGQISTIDTIQIVYRDNFQQRLAGYHLYVSNSTTTPTDGVLCYEDTSSTRSAVQLVVTHQCPYVGRYVTVYNYRNNTKRYNWYDDYAILELCEVQVYGCPVGMYGNGNCNQLCPASCYGGNCNSRTGFCIYCSPGKYGTVCENNCLASCKDSLCNKDSGFCLECVDGKFGNTCDQDCSVNCKNSLCAQDNGFCIDCVPGKFGNKCDQNCSVNCLDRLCAKDTGYCDECIVGKHGISCGDDCPRNCKDNVCVKDSGLCNACVLTKRGATCHLDCPPNCGNGVCDKDSAACSSCTGGFYGINCSIACGGNCSECNQQSGQCTKCQAGLYGMNCSLPCGHCSSCQLDSGVCMVPCNPGYEGSLCQTKQVQKTESPPTTVNAGPIAGAVVGVIIAAVIAVVIFFVIRRRRLSAAERDAFVDIGRSKVDEKRIHDEPLERADSNRNTPDKNIYCNVLVSDEQPDELPKDSANIYVNAHQVVQKPGSGDSVYYNSGPVGFPVSSLKSLVQTKLQNKAKVFVDEYKSIPFGDLHEHSVGMLPQNKAKNRFKTTFPYDHSRVVLDSIGKDPHSDYINANYIDSVTKTAEYVATQGPRPGTVNDFWRMIWQLKSGKIVMLTNLIEGGKPKCDKYWPDEGEPLSTENFSIIMDRERSYAFYVIRDLTVTEKKTKSVRQIHQFHYTTWPDHGTPNTNELVVFHRRVKNYKTLFTGKMVVHCSAGIGRTGTFLGLDALLEYGKEFGRIDVMQYIKTMRKDRVNMVQTVEQYISIHQLLIEAFDLPDTLIPKTKYHTALTALSDDVPTNQTKLRKEYQLAQSLKPKYNESDCKAALLPTNKKKNKTLSVLAVDRFRTYLRSHASDRTDYINAVVVPSYTSKTGYIVTQTPLEDTVVDLLTMVMDHNCQTIVIIEPDDNDWLPEEGQEKTIEDFKLEHRGKSSTIPNVDLSEISIKNQSYDFNDTVRVFHMTGWGRDSPIPQDSSMLLQLLEHVDSRRKSDDTKTTIVMCRDGYSQSGLFCCISSARDQMKSDEEVDILQISRQLLVRRPEFLISFEQYQCCYNMIKDYLETTDVYIN